MARLGKYRVHNFLFDLVMLVITFGWWGLWIIIREVRNLAR